MEPFLLQICKNADKQKDKEKRQLTELKHDLSIDLFHIIDIVIWFTDHDLNACYYFICLKMNLLNKEEDFYDLNGRFIKIDQFKFTNYIIPSLKKELKDYEPSDENEPITKYTIKHPQYYLDMIDQILR